MTATQEDVARLFDLEEIVDTLDSILEEFGCEPDALRLPWIHARLTELTSLRSQNKGMREALEEIAGFKGEYSAPWPECRDGYATFAVMQSRSALKALSPTSKEETENVG